MDWQQGIVYAAVALAALYLARGAAAARRGGCGGCGTCERPAEPDPPAAPLVQIALAPPRPGENGRPRD